MATAPFLFFPAKSSGRRASRARLHALSLLLSIRAYHHWLRAKSLASAHNHLQVAKGNDAPRFHLDLDSGPTGIDRDFVAGSTAIRLEEQQRPRWAKTSRRLL